MTRKEGQEPARQNFHLSMAQAPEVYRFEGEEYQDRNQEEEELHE